MPWLHHYVHKDGLFEQGNLEAMAQIVRSGSVKEAAMEKAAKSGKSKRAPEAVSRPSKRVSTSRKDSTSTFDKSESDFLYTHPTQPQPQSIPLHPGICLAYPVPYVDPYPYYIKQEFGQEHVLEPYTLDIPPYPVEIMPQQLPSESEQYLTRGVQGQGLRIKKEPNVEELTPIDYSGSVPSPFQ